MKTVFISGNLKQLRKELLIPENEQNPLKAYEMVKAKINEIIGNLNIEKLDVNIQ